MDPDDGDDLLAALAAGPLEQRAGLNVGRRVSLPRFVGRCLGDDVSWRGESALRCVALQAAGTGGDRHEWGRSWGTALRDMGADLAVIAETRISTQAQHASACNGLLDMGFSAVSHNVPDSPRPLRGGRGGGREAGRGPRPAAPSLPGPRSAGVVLAVRRSCAGEFSQVHLGPHGRAIAASVALADGATVRCIALYGVTGACGPSFETSRHAVAAERSLCDFVRAEAAAADAQAMHAVAFGDLNSFTDRALDTWGGHYLVRPGCLAALLQELGFRDSFRERHPDLRAFSCVSHFGGASRLDQVWVRSPPGLEIVILNASIVSQWPGRTDHDPVVADLALALPGPDSMCGAGSPPRWRRVLSAMQGPEAERMRRSVSAAMEPLRGSFALARQGLSEVCAACGRLPDASLPPAATGDLAHLALDHIAPWYASPDRRTLRTAGFVDAAYASIERAMLDSLPCPPPPGGARSRLSAAAAWERCLHRLRALIMALATYSRDSVSRRDMGRYVRGGRRSLSTAPANAAWQRGLRLLRPLAGRARDRVARIAQQDGRGVPSSLRPADWAVALGFPAAVAEEWAEATSGEVPLGGAGPADPRPLFDLDRFPGSLEWLRPPRSQAAALECINLARSWADLARAARDACNRADSRAFLEWRASSLRLGDLRTWARSMRPKQVRDAGYTPSWVASGDGSRKRPGSAADVLLGASQEWSALLQEPAMPWSHPLFDEWRDGMGNRRGSISLPSLCESAQGSPLRRVAGPLLEDAPCRPVRWELAEVLPHPRLTVKVAGWLLRPGSDGGWVGSLPGPCGGSELLVVNVNGGDPREWDPDRWLHGGAPGGGSYLVLVRAAPHWGDLVRPLSLEERGRLMRRGKLSRPGPSGWKVAFLPLFPPWAQDAYWHLVDTQRACASVASALRCASQVNLAKASGGHRPITMLEESFKVIEGPVARRMVSSRSALPDDSVYSSANLASESGRSAAPEVLYLDALVCEDAQRHRRPLCRVPADYEKFFNTIELPVVDSVMQVRGVPDPARRLVADAFTGMRVAVETRAGPAPPIVVNRGFPQGSVSGPEASKPAQEPILRMRRTSPAQYVTSAGRRVACAGYVDDAEHYGSGAADLPTIVAELGLGSVATGIGFAWPKFSAYASDWDDFLASPASLGSGMTVTDIAAEGWDIWRGGAAPGRIPRALSDTVEKLLGKRGSICDRHSIAASDLLSRLRGVRHLASARRCSWDETAALYQLVVRGVLSYAPLVGIVDAAELHAEDAAFQRLVLSGLGTRGTAERTSLLARRARAGLQLPSVVEAAVAGVAKDVLLLLNGSSPASLLARDSLREGMSLPPEAVVDFKGVVPNAMRFLAGYGIYIGVSTDRTVSRLLDALALRLACDPQPLVGPFDPRAHRRAADLCRVGRLANSFRLAVARLRDAAVPPGAWGAPDVWVPALVGLALLSPAECAAAARGAGEASSRDWQVECSIFCVRHRPLLPEDWGQEAWLDPWGPSADRRSRHLDSVAPDPGPGEDIALYGDGGFVPGVGATFSAQARAFGPDPHYWQDSGSVSLPVASRLPRRYGHEECTVHTAELAALLSSLRWRRAGEWNMLVCDRSSLFSLLSRLEVGSMNRLHDCACAPLEARLRSVLRELASSWHPGAPPPSWRVHQRDFPQQWDVRRPVSPSDPRLRWWCQVPYVSNGVVGVDVKSHQIGPPCPAAVVVQGNEAQDRACDAARSGRMPPDVLMPSGGFFATLSVGGRTVTRSPARAIRALLREQALGMWMTKPVQGKVACMPRALFFPCLDVSSYTCCSVPERWRRFLLPGDLPGTVDLSKMLYRCLRAIGGGWTEMLHVDSSLAVLAGPWAERRGLPSHRWCPLCRSAAGTPRHVVMTCPAVSEQADAVRDAVEAELVRHVPSDTLCELAEAWWLRETENGRGGLRSPCRPGAAERWPSLHAWRWLLPMPDREAVINADAGGHGARGTSLEGAVDLAYRCAMPRALGAALCRGTGRAGGDVGSDSSSDDGEEFATLAEPDPAAAEASRRIAAMGRYRPAVEVTSVLALGLRSVRSLYAEQVGAWRQLAEAEVASLRPAPAAAPAQPLPPGPPPGAPARPFFLVLRSLLADWSATVQGRRTVRELRWQLPTADALVARLRAELPRTGARAGQVLSEAGALGIPYRGPDGARWGDGFLAWDAARAPFASLCSCGGDGAPPAPRCCPTCGGTVLPAPPAADALPLCPWCGGEALLACPGCHCGVHFTGQCGRWLAGAHPRFGQGPLDATWLCPDCSWAWVRRLGPEPPPLPVASPAALSAHLEEVARICLPGAGACPPGPIIRVRHARRCLLRRLPWGRMGPSDLGVPAAGLCRSVATELAAPAAPHPASFAVVLSALACLCREGKASWAASPGGLLVGPPRPAGGDAGAPAPGLGPV